MAWIYCGVDPRDASMTRRDNPVDPRHAWMNVGYSGTMLGINPAIVPFPAQLNATSMLLPSENLLYR
ncbi:hypothetical protein [Stenotrophomonas sp. SAU14A_NAIMI4_5]|uniref:hypothetical protein n=1 Tax=Stenotrophomonas sp. SAU14A_NAIMI4_5 TaxID=2072413 RepID=UPI00131EE72B|nr:hypothetical protein [Stenotrophomonas sp. SAU14A_NAIMI4_5]